MQIPGQCPETGRLAGLDGLFVLCLVDGVGAQQIVELEAVGGGLRQQMCSDQDVEQVLCPAVPDSGEGGDRRDLELGPRMQPEQPEETRGFGGQRPIGPGEHRAHRVCFLVVSHGQSLPKGGFVTEVSDQLVKAHQGRIGGPFGGDAQRQRQPGTQARQLGQLLRVVLGPIPGGDGTQQGHGFRLGQRAQRQPMRPVPDGQPRQCGYDW